MIKLLIHSTKPTELNATSFGGRPVKNSGEDFQWPSCKHCKLPMQFLGKIAKAGKLHQLFMCQNEPGMCEDWDANEGGNAVLVSTPRNLELVDVPSQGICLRDTEYSAEIVEEDAASYNELINPWAEKNGVSPRQVLGKIGGEPEWLQGDETPTCDECKQPMKLLAQLEQGPDYKTEMNFGGGGVAYSFTCECDQSAKFLWQC